MSNIILIIKGLIIGFAKVMPGVSGAILALSMGVYDKGIMAITNFFKDPKKNFNFLFYLGLGILISIILGSRVVYFLITNYYTMTMFLFIGLIFGSSSKLFNKRDRTNKGLLITIITFIGLTYLSLINIHNNINATNSFFIYVISGLLDAFGMIVPGISSTSLLMIIGTYDNILYTISNIVNYNNFISNMSIMFPYLFGIFVGIVITSILVSYMFKKHYNITFSFIIGVILSNLLLLTINIPINNIKDLTIGILLLSLGSFISYSYGD